MEMSDWKSKKQNTLLTTCSTLSPLYTQKWKVIWKKVKFLNQKYFKIVDTIPMVWFGSLVSKSNSSGMELNSGSFICLSSSSSSGVGISPWGSQSVLKITFLYTIRSNLALGLSRQITDHINNWVNSSSVVWVWFYLRVDQLWTAGNMPVCQLWPGDL